MVTAALFTIYKCHDMEATIAVIYIHAGILLSHKKEWNFAICSNMDGLGGHCAK